MMSNLAIRFNASPFSSPIGYHLTRQHDFLPPNRETKEIYFLQMQIISKSDLGRVVLSCFLSASIVTGLSLNVGSGFSSLLGFLASGYLDASVLLGWFRLCDLGLGFSGNTVGGELQAASLHSLFESVPAEAVSFSANIEIRSREVKQ
jgi:hypothetical protein